MDVEVAADATARDVATAIARTLATAGVPSPDADARWLIEGVTGLDPFRSPAAPLPKDRVDALMAAVARRTAREPLQLILSSTSFRGIALVCRAGVFVPRPETEVVAGHAIAAARARGPGPLTVVDACTGSGAIACCLAVEVASVRVVATDRDIAAVDLARHNLSRVRDGAAGVAGFAPGSDVEVVRCDLLEGIDPSLRGHVDVLVSNPPYLPESDRGTWEPEVGGHDPVAALVGGDDGHEAVDALLTLAADWLTPGGTAVIEIDERRAADAVRVAGDAGLVDVEVARDLAGAERCVVARRPR
jgi:release factor glutamine methyltransferase